MTDLAARPRGRAVWRVLVPVTVAAGALLLVTSAHTSRGTDLRSSRVLEVGQLAARQQATVTALAKQVAALRADISAASSRAGAEDRRVRAAQQEAHRLAEAAGLTEVTGPALTVTLDDAPRAAARSDLAAGAGPDDLVIHQQDVQGVVNALWAGGAEAMTLMGQRVVATTAVRCVGNTLLLHGQVFSPPFVVTAIGPVPALRRSLAADPAVQVFRQYVAAYGLRYRERESRRETLTAYRGDLSLGQAEAVS